MRNSFHIPGLSARILRETKNCWKSKIKHEKMHRGQRNVVFCVNFEWELTHITGNVRSPVAKSSQQNPGIHLPGSLEHVFTQKSQIFLTFLQGTICSFTQTLFWDIQHLHHFTFLLTAFSSIQITVTVRISINSAISKKKLQDVL